MLALLSFLYFTDFLIIKGGFSNDRQTYDQKYKYQLWVTLSKYDHESGNYKIQCMAMRVR